MKGGTGSIPARFQRKLRNRTVAAKTAYLDTANWIDLANGGPIADRFERAVGGGRIVPVLSITHLIPDPAIVGAGLVRRGAGDRVWGAGVTV